MGPGGIRQQIRRYRRHLAVVVVTSCLAATVALAHSGAMEGHSSAVAVWCLAVMPGVAVLAMAAGAAVRMRPPAVPTFVDRGVLGSRGVAAWACARDGPATGTVLRL